MKRQYLGDERDLFKYDLIRQISKQISHLQRVTFIPMLTPNEVKATLKGHGKKRTFESTGEQQKPGSDNIELIAVLKEYKEIDWDERDFAKLWDYFRSEYIDIFPYKDKLNEQDEYFSRRKSEYINGIHKYFNEIPQEVLENSLIFVDPDIGLEVKYPKEKHLLYCEVKHLYDHMNENSMLMVYQHFPQGRKANTNRMPNKRREELKLITGDLPLCISNNEIAFLVLMKNQERKSTLARTLEEYKNSHNYRMHVCISPSTNECCHKQ